MNIFALHKCPFYSAILMCDKQVVKMILESAQLLSTAHYLNQSTVVAYKPTHVKHKCTLWASSTSSNYDWLFAHMVGLINEYHFRYGNIHTCSYLLQDLSINPCVIGDLQSFALAMPDEHQCFQSHVDCYRSYYKSKPDFIFKYTGRQVPEWLEEARLKKLK
jgi:hypothetical protein